MNGCKLVTLSIVYLFFTSSKSAANAAAVMTTFEPFYGDMALERYIEQIICSVAHEPNIKWSFVYVHQLNTIENNSTTKQTKRANFPLPTFKPHLLRCFTAVYRQINASQLSANLNSLHFEYKEVLTVINLPSSSSAHFAQTLTTLNWLYIDCRRCLPFLLLLQPNAQPNLLKNAHSSAQLNSTFPLKAVVTFLNISKHPQALHLNPVLDGCAQTIGIFEPKSSHDFDRLKTAPSKCHLNNSQLRAAINEDLSHCNVFLDNHQKITKFIGSDVDLLRLLEQKYHFSTTLLYNEQHFSPVFDNRTKQWSGLIGLVHSGAAHFGFCGLSNTPERRQYVDFTSFINLDSYSPLTRYPGLKSRQWLVLEPLSPGVWLLLAAGFLLTLLAIVLLKKVNQEKENLLKTAEQLYRILLNNGKDF